MPKLHLITMGTVVNAMFDIEEPLYEEIPGMKVNELNEDHVNKSDVVQLSDLLDQVKILETKKQIAYEKACRTIRDTAEKQIQSIREQEQSLLQEVKELHSWDLATMKEVERDLHHHLHQIQELNALVKVRNGGLSFTESKEHLKLDTNKALVIQLSQTFAKSRTAINFVPYAEQGLKVHLGMLHVCSLGEDLNVRTKTRAYSLPNQSYGLDLHIPQTKPALPPRNKNKLLRHSFQEGKCMKSPLLNRVKLSSSLDSHLNMLGQSNLAVYSKPRLMRSIKLKGSKLGELDRASDLVLLPNGDLLVAELGCCRIQHLPRNGQPSAIRLNTFIKPKGICLTQEGYIATVDEFERNLKVFTRSGQLTSKFGTGNFKDPSIINITGQDTYVMLDSQGPWQQRVLLYDPMSGVTSTLGMDSRGNNMISCPEYVIMDRRDRVLVCDSGSSRIWVFQRDGKLMRKFGEHGDRPGQLSFPKGVCADMQGNIIVADYGNHRVSMFDARGKFIQHLLVHADGIKFPRIVKTNPEGSLVVLHENGVEQYQLGNSVLKL